MAKTKQERGMPSDEFSEDSELTPVMSRLQLRMMNGLYALAAATGHVETVRAAFNAPPDEPQHVGLDHLAGSYEITGEGKGYEEPIGVAALSTEAQAEIAEAMEKVGGKEKVEAELAQEKDD